MQAVKIDESPVEIQELTREHIIDLFPRRRGESEKTDLNGLISIIEQMKDPGICAALVKGNKTLAVMGIRLVYGRHGYCWIVGTHDIPKYGREFTERSYDLFHRTRKAMGLKRVQADVVVDEPSWVKWAEGAGFTREGIARKFNIHEQDCYIMAHIDEEID